MLNLTGQLSTAEISDSVKQKNSLSVWDDIIARTMEIWIRFLGYTGEIPLRRALVPYPEKSVMFWFPKMEGRADRDNRLSEDGMTITEMDTASKTNDRETIPYLVFAGYQGREAGGAQYYKFVGVFKYSAQDSQDGVKRVYKRISDHLIWKNGNPADFEWQD